MNTVLELRTDLESDRISVNRIPIDATAPGLRLLGRASLRLGLALLLWGERRHRTIDPEELRRLQLARRSAEEARERAFVRAALYR